MFSFMSLCTDFGGIPRKHVLVKHAEDAWILMMLYVGQNKCVTILSFQPHFLCLHFVFLPLMEM